MSAKQDKMKRAVIMATGIVLLGLGASVPCGATTVKEIQIRNLGTGPVDEGFVRAKIAVRVGSELDRQVISKDVKTLLDTGRFSGVEASEDVLDIGVRVVFAVRNKPKLQDPVSVAGAEYFRASKIRDLLGLTVGDFVDDQVLGVRVQKVVDEYRSDYFPDAKVSWQIQDTDRVAGLAKVTVSIDEGGRAKVTEIRFEGNRNIPASTLRDALKQPAPWNPMWLFRQRRYDPDELEAARVGIRDMYMNRGYLDALVDLPVIERIDKNGLRVTVRIKEGICYRLATLSVSGVALFPERELQALLKAKPGDVASAETVFAIAQAVRDYYGSRGYINTVVKPMLKTDESHGTVQVTFAVTEGTLTHIRNVEIRGNTRTRDKVIRRELLVYPGDIYDEVKIRRSEKILTNLGFFETVRSSPIPTRIADEKDLAFQVEEKRTGNIMVGMGFSSVDKLMGFMDLSQANFDIAGWPYFTGGGEKVKLHIQEGSTMKDYDLSFIEPWFLDQKLSLGTDFYSTESDYTDYNVTRLGAAISLGKAIPGANRLDVRYRLERIDVGGVSDTNEYFYADPPNKPYYFEQDAGTLTESTLSVSLTHDDRDNPFVPTRGNRTSATASLTGGPLGFSTDIYDLNFTSAEYVPLWFRHVFSVRTRWEVVDEYGSTSAVPIEDRLFIGGPQTIRGFEYRAVGGPKVVREISQAGVEQTARQAIGGQSFAMASAEYSIPVVSKVRFVGFYDVGNVWSDPYEFDLNNVAIGAGIGLRLDIPGFPIRIDYAWPIKKDSELTNTTRWSFWIGFDH